MNSFIHSFKIVLACFFLLPMCISCSKAEEVLHQLRPMWRTDLPPVVPPDRYSDRIFKYVMDGRTYHMPENYKFFDSWGGDNAKLYFPSHLQFYLTYPTFEGVTHELAEVLRHSPTYGRYPSIEIGRKYAAKRIVVFEARPLTPKEGDEAKWHRASGTYQKERLEDITISRASWGEVVESEPFGLSCISPKTNPDVVRCEGTTLKGEPLQIECGAGKWLDVGMHRCRVERGSVEEGYFAYYEYAKELLPHWDEIDAGVFAKLNSWEKK